MARPRRYSEREWRRIVDRAVELRSARAAGSEANVSEGSIRRWADIFGVSLVGAPGRRGSAHLCTNCAGEKRITDLLGDTRICEKCSGRGVV